MTGTFVSCSLEMSRLHPVLPVFSVSLHLSELTGEFVAVVGWGSWAGNERDASFTQCTNTTHTNREVTHTNMLLMLVEVRLLKHLGMHFV